MSGYEISVLFQYNFIMAQAGNLDSVRSEGYRRGADASSAEKETKYSLLLNSPKNRGRERWREQQMATHR